MQNGLPGDIRWFEDGIICWILIRKPGYLASLDSTQDTKWLDEFGTIVCVCAFSYIPSHVYALDHVNCICVFALLCFFFVCFDPSVLTGDSKWCRAAEKRLFQVLLLNFFCGVLGLFPAMCPF